MGMMAKESTEWVKTSYPFIEILLIGMRFCQEEGVLNWLGTQRKVNTSLHTVCMVSESDTFARNSLSSKSIGILCSDILNRFKIHQIGILTKRELKHC